MPVHDELGKRMKEFYENIPKIKLMRRTPVIIRIDGKAFHTFTKRFRKPFDDVLMQSMRDTMKYLCENIQGCVFGYTQSDEISLLLIDYKKLNTSAWFDYEIQKLCSISASMATVMFNQFFNENASKLETKIKDNEMMVQERLPNLIVYNSVKNRAMFDARCFNIPKEEVVNYFYWRQIDAVRNSILMVGQSNFSHNQLMNKSCNNIKEMLDEQKEINWDDYPTNCKRGTACYKHPVLGWMNDNETPMFFGDDRNYIEKWIEVEEND